ncbi:Reverse transcriptase domain [Arabidopsis thaliana x Arabidopsis arenosa]|uniref:Reverse transcriptase domain n=1 Tax=Arabidopsis thaliana x Arabidopsis arenosa TaxID=1240361 RepID=A0A8T1YBC8_9BRAS|nr:Reverse transcriptase domain [Arabidopsis thaliana x Arabidopsis arenosa]
MADNIRRALQQINLGIDEAPFAIPQAIVQQAAAENRFCLIGRPLMPRKQNLRQIIATLPRSWGLVGFVRGRIVEQRRFLFVFPSEESLETVLRRGPWSYADRMLVLRRWSPEMDPLSLNFIPFWIQIRGIPLQFMNLAVIDSIARSLGDRMEVDFDEATITRVQFVRVRVNWNVDHPLRFQRNYQFFPGVNTVLSFFYERLRGFCEVCGMMTHDSGSCLIQNGGPGNSDGDDDEEGDQELHGNPGVHIQEIGDDGQPIADEDAEGAINIQMEPADGAPAVDKELSDIDPDHNALEDILSEEWDSDEDTLLNPFPSFVNVTGDAPGPVEILARELRKRKQGPENGESSKAQKQKLEVENQNCLICKEESNGQGMGQPLTIRRLEEIQKVYLLDVLFLVETKQRDDRIRDLGVSLGFNEMCLVSPRGLSGGLAVLWQKHLSVKVISHDVRLVDLYVEYKSFNFYLSCVYGNPIPSERQHLWEKLQRLSVNRTGPWMMCGDFNEILQSHEKKGGRTRSSGSLRNFQTMINCCNMKDLKYKGNPFSWVGKRQKETIECCLDRVFINSDWQAMYPASETEFLPIAGSDHAPVIIDIAEEFCVKRGQFRYDKRLIKSEDFVESVKRGWHHGQTDDHGGIQNKLRLCRREMANWKRTVKTNSAEQIQILKHRLDAAERNHLTPLSTVRNLRRDLNQAYRDEELYWKLKSRNKWLDLGDRNTKYFHAISKVRKSKNRIKSVRDDHDIEHFRDDAIGKIAESYFTDLFSTSQQTDLEELLSSIDTKVTTDMNKELLQPVSDQEIKKAVFSIGADRAPGFDGFTAAFYHQFWDLISDDVCAMVRRFFETGDMDTAINKTQICLIPKIEEPKHMSEYRPISLCTVNYKIISKVMIMRLKKCFGSVISDSQAAFVPGRSITDNVLIAHELLHSLKSRRDCQNAYLAIKTDISKAYDRVEWNFLERVMKQMGFDQRWVKWIMECVKTVSYEVLINGSPYGHILPTRGLRQGDPLSPYLFLFCAEVLSHMLRKAEQDRQIHGIKLSQDCPSISHLLFADDSLFFCRSTNANCEHLARIFKTYEDASGQKINYAKSSVIFGTKTSEQKKRRLQRILSIDRVGGGGKYLGLPEQFGRKKVELFEYIVEKVKTRTEGWSQKYLSPAGKEILIKSVALALPVYSMNCFTLPVTICNEINSVLTSFWWGKDNGKKKIPWVAWKRLSIPKKEGGIGFKDLQQFNKALLAKQAWRILKNPSSLLARLYKGLYHPSTTYLKAQNVNNASYGWRSIQDGKTLLQKGLQVRIGNGTNTRVWEDPWLPTLPPRPASGPIIDANMTVSDLWLTNKREWDPMVFEGVLNPEDQHLAKQLYLSQHAIKDTYEWAYTNSAQYTVRSGYWVATHVDIIEEEAIPPPQGSIPLKQEIWKLKISPKLQHFLWRGLSGALSTATQVRTRNIPANPICQRCCQEEETINHLLFQCPYAQAVWRGANIDMNHHITPDSDFEDNLHTFLQLQKNQSVPLQRRLLPFWIMWRIWKSRNDFIFQKINRCPVREAQKGVQDVIEWLDATLKQAEDTTSHMTSALPQPQRTVRNSHWSPPPTGWLKCNFDSGFKQEQSYTNTGWIFRDYNGQVILSGCSRLQASQSPLQAEALGFLHVLQIAWIHGFRTVYFEGDNLELNNLINTGQDHRTLGTLLYDIRFWMLKLPLSSLGHVNREKNAAADRLSRHALFLNSLYETYNAPPSWLVDYLYYPYTV